MTETELRQKAVATAKKYVGCKESNGSHRRFVDAYNAFRPLPRQHRMTYTAAWCATFVSAVAIECGLTDIMPVECGCGYMIALYKKLGRWQEDEHYTPKPGDVIFYDWQDGANFAATDNKGSPDHVGIVTAASCGVISVIEGNKDDAVAYRTVTVNGRYIRGFGLPDYGSKATELLLARAGLLKSLQQEGFFTCGFGCMSCIGNSGPLSAAMHDVADEIELASVLSGNRNFEGRISPDVSQNYLMALRHFD